MGEMETEEEGWNFERQSSTKSEILHGHELILDIQLFITSELSPSNMIKCQGEDMANFNEAIAAKASASNGSVLGIRSAKAANKAP
ncbi:hypothetical protein TorRG33x02_250890 [Trema orientale]|uniref:Uncharacterized protein n=1 Tax=Trema orientale TaxID=63057 RepID=A0A2P5DHY4_TREOI|nr:hypothetical protein TorRG33x02_250890 [Trema orientale]